MSYLFSGIRKLFGDVLSIVRYPTKINSILQIPLYANALYLILTNTINSVFGFVFWIIASHVYTTEVVGLASAILSAASLLAMLSGLGFGYGLIRFLKASDNPVKLINSTFTVTGLLSLLVAVIFIVGLGIWAPGLDILRENPHYLIVFMLFVPASVLDDLADHAMMGERQAKFVFIHNLIFNILRVALPVLLAVVLQSFGIFGSWSAALFVSFLVTVFLLLPRAQPGYRLCFVVDRKPISEVLRYSSLNYLSDLLWNMPGLILPIIVINLLGAKNNAYFYMAWAMSSVLTMIPWSVASSLLAEGANDESKLKNHIQRSLKMATLLTIPIVVLVWFLANRFLLFYGGQYARNASTLLRWLAIATLPLAINVVYFTIKRIQKNVKPVILLTGFMAFIVVIASYLLLPRFGVNGVGIAWLAGQSVIAIIAVTCDMRHWI
jgi:O-antigen/teichoic acid export membrane protein